ncbi:hypothetical protein C8R45DRAFT_769079, partial [Mycena sanguinolenta]
AERLAKAWDLLLPQLEEPYAQYQQDSHGKRLSFVPSSIWHECTTSCGSPVDVKVQCLYISLAVLLVQHGVFPASPTRTRTGFSIDLLEIYRAFFERSCDAITAVGAALHTIYDRRGFKVLSSRNVGMRAVDPFRESLGNAVLWSSNLRDRLRNKLNVALEAADRSLHQPAATPLPASSNCPDASRPLTPGRASRLLRERCPACFGLEEWGRDLQKGGDVILGADGCVSYRHLRSAGDGPISYDPTYFVSAEKVQAVRQRILQARKKPRTAYSPRVPTEVTDACEDSWEAANEKKRKADPKRYDASGIFVLTCRHSQVLFLANIDTPGEQQQYIVALMEEARENLPPQATILQGYDVGCFLDHSLNLYPILTEGFRERVSFIINAMHAFGHGWICQIFYSPRMRPGAGSADLEGVERFWYRIRKLIPITRAQWNSRRIWIIDQYTSFVNDEGRENLGSWITRQQTKNLASKSAAAQKVLRQCRVPEAELRQQWEEQKAAQTSMRSHAPARLRREIDQVLKLQTQIDAVEKSIVDTKESIKRADASPDALDRLRRLEATHGTLKTQAEALYTSLNIDGNFPELKGLPLPFVHTLILMHNLKRSIRSAAENSFHEWETLDWAVAGRREPLGTKLHQKTRKAISKRKPALHKAIEKFNACCADLERLRPPGCSIPIPSPLSTRLNGLRDDPALAEDVWITPSTGPIPRWLDDDNVRDGIRSLHCADRCAEEAVQLNLERENLRRWLDEERAIVLRAMNSSTSTFLSSLPLASHLYLLPAGPGLINMAVALSASASASASAPAPASASAPPSAPAQTRFTSATPLVPIDLSDDEDVFEQEHTGEDEVEAQVELDPGMLSDADQGLLAQELLSDDEGDEEESSGVEGTAVQFEIGWESALHFRNTSSQIPLTCNARLVLGGDDRPNHILEAEDVDRICGQTGRLNNFALNGLAESLLNVYGQPASPYASHANTYIHRVRYKASDETLWRHLAPTKYWEKSFWLVPIHRTAEQHWVFVVIAVRDQQLFFFDSLAQETGWRRDIRASGKTTFPISHELSEHSTKLLSYLSNLKDSPRQTNAHDCGIWVVSMIAAVLRGKGDVSLTEQDMGQVRRIL